MNISTDLIPKFSFQSIFLLIFILFVAVPIALFWFWPISQAAQNEHNEVRERHLLLAQNVGAALQRYHRDIISTFEYFVSKTPDSGLSVETNQMLENLNIRQICTVKPYTGEVILNITSTPFKCPDQFSPEKLAIFNGIAVNDQTVLTGVMPDPSGDPVIYLVRRTSEKLTVGVLKTDYFVKLGLSIAFGKKGYSVIIDQFGNVLGGS